MHGIADHGDLARVHADGLAEAEHHARIGLGAQPRIAPHGEIEKMEHVVLHQRCLQPSRRVVGGEPDAEASALELHDGVAGAADERRVLGAAGAENALDSHHQLTSRGNLRMRGEGLRDVQEIASR